MTKDDSWIDVPPGGLRLTRLASVLTVALTTALATSAVAAPAADQFFDSDGVKIRYVDQGPRDGEPLLLIHGFAANVEFQWGPILPTLTKERRVVAFDCRGHGKSDKPRDAEAYGLHMVKDAERLLAHLEIDQADVLGYSMGAGLAGRFAMLYPQRTRALVMGGAGLMPDAAFTAVFTELATTLENEGSMAPLVRALTPPGAPQPSNFQVRSADVMMMGMNDSRALAAMVRGFLPMLAADAKEPPEHWRQITAPTLAIVGGADPLAPSVRRSVAMLPDAKLVVIPQADHVTAVLAPQFVKSVDEFLDAVPAATP
ncbi:MAG: alpha/beta hydrolase [Pirellulales bacterium]|nr:alpha/beta hydrolase [Pirellulales bacterium]